MNIRVHELAKELNISSKDVIGKLKEMGVEVKNHLSVVAPPNAERLRSQIGVSDQKQGKERSGPPSSAPLEAKNNAETSQDHKEKVSLVNAENHQNKAPQQGGSRPGVESRPPQQEGQHPVGNRLSQQGGPRPVGNRPPQQGGPRPVGSRPLQQDGPRPMGNRPPQQGGPRPVGNRPPQQGGPRPVGNRPPQQDGPRPMGNRPPQQGGPRPVGNRPPQQGGPHHGMGERPLQQGGPRPMGNRPPQQGGPRPMGNRPPQQGGPRPMGNRPPQQGGPRPMGNRPPQQGGPRPMGNRPPQQGGPRPMGNRPPQQGGPRHGMGERPQQQQGGARSDMGERLQPRNTRNAATTTASTAITEPKRQAAPNRKTQENRGFERRRETEREVHNRPPRRNNKNNRPQEKEVKDTTPKHIVIPETIMVQDLAAKMSRKASELIVRLINLGVMATINQELDAETATILANEMGVSVEVKIEKPLTVIEEIVDPPESLKPRPPVVTVMGHVDHGKTSLLDAIRTTKVTASEAGGITQHIGAYQVEINGQKITFLDTPGHEAFTAMRARGAQATDIAVLVVAADDGVMPQTIEAINHAKAAEVPIIVAINKIDKENANPDKVKQELTEYGLIVEEWGGDTIAVPVSAKTKYNLDQLLEMILLVAEVKELKANPNRPATGTVIEAELDKGRGPVATVLVAKGTLNVGDIVVAGCAFGKVRAMIDDKGRRVKKALPSTPVEIQGLSEVPGAGDHFYVVNDEKLARQITDARLAERKAEEAKQTTVKVSLDDLFDRIKEGEVKELNIIIKGDVQGSVEALKQSLIRLSTDEVRVNPIHGGVGAITETDVMLAAASNAIIIGFNVRPDSNTKATAELQGVDLRLYRVIYDAIEDVKAAMSGLLEPDYKEVVLGKAEVRQVFKVPKAGTVAGSIVTEGKIARASKVRVIRDGIVIHEGELDSLRRFKDDIKEVTEGFECGIDIENFNDIKEGDVIESFIMEEIKRHI